MWGSKNTKDKYNFEWPTQKMIDEMQDLESLKLESIKFAKAKKAGDAISLV